MSYPKSEDKKIQKITNLLVKYAEKEEVEFSLGGNQLTPVEALSFFSGLALFLIPAKETYEKIYNNLHTVEELFEVFNKKSKKYKEEDLLKEKKWLEEQPIEYEFPIAFYEKEVGNFFGFEPRTIKTKNSSFANLLFFTQFELEKYIKIYKKTPNLLIDGRIPLEPLYEQMLIKINDKKIKILPSRDLEIKKQSDI